MDEELHALATAQRNRVARRQLIDLGMSAKAIDRRVSRGRLVTVHSGVYALPPVLEDEVARWIGVTLTAPDTYLNRLSAACAYGVLEHRPSYETVVRPGIGGRRRCDGIVIYRSTTLEGETSTFSGIPITTMPRTLLDLAGFVSQPALARGLRQAIRLGHTTMREVGDYLGASRGRVGQPRLANAVARYHGLPLERARSGAEIRALEVLRDAGKPMPRLNTEVAGHEADLSWPSQRLIIEIDGGPYHLDRGEDARKEAAWRGAGWHVARIPSDVVYDSPAALVALAPR